jgi:hypothetical protein
MVRLIHRTLRHAGAAALVGAFAGLALPACQQGAEGDRCNPALIQSGGAVPAYNEDECNKGSGLSCQVPPTCAIAVCCPSSPPYTDPNCACFANPSAGCACSVPALLDVDAGPDSGPDAAPSDASSPLDGTQG